MYSASDLRKGLKIQIDGEPYIVWIFSSPNREKARLSTGPNSET